MIFVGRDLVPGHDAWRELVLLQITPSERNALELIANGMTPDEIARCLGVTVADVEGRLEMLFAKMGTATRVDAVAAAFRRGLLRTP